MDYIWWLTTSGWWLRKDDRWQMIYTQCILIQKVICSLSHVTLLLIQSQILAHNLADNQLVNKINIKTIFNSGWVKCNFLVYAILWHLSWLAGQFFLYFEVRQVTGWYLGFMFCVCLFSTLILIKLNHSQNFSLFSTSFKTVKRISNLYWFKLFMFMMMYD